MAKKEFKKEDAQLESVNEAINTTSQWIEDHSNWIIGVVADIQLNYSLFATVAIFLPLSLLVIKKLK